MHERRSMGSIHWMALVILLVSQFTTSCVGDFIEPAGRASPEIDWVLIPSTAATEAFWMSATEVTYKQYVEYLNAALAAGAIHVDLTTQEVRNAEGLKMTSLDGSRVVKDHNGNGIFELEEMENPLNMSFLAYDDANHVFYIEDPATVDWQQFFDRSVYPNVVDSMDDWYELSGNKDGFVGEGDEDGELPDLEEIGSWPVNHITYYGAEAFAVFYGWELPTMAQWRVAASGGLDFVYATSDGTASDGIAWINFDGPSRIPHKGHAQPAASKNPNPYGLYNMGGNVWEWVKDWYNGYEVFSRDKRTEDFFIDDGLSDSEAFGKYLKGILGGSFNYFTDTMLSTWNHAARPQAGNDHFGFRVVRSD